jgi:hypothetical protein
VVRFGGYRLIDVSAQRSILCNSLSCCRAGDAPHRAAPLSAVDAVQIGLVQCSASTDQRNPIRDRDKRLTLSVLFAILLITGFRTVDGLADLFDREFGRSTTARTSYVVVRVAAFLKGFQDETEFFVFDGETPIAAITSHLHAVPPRVESG